MTVRLLRVRQIGRPVLLVALPQFAAPLWFGAVGERAGALWAWLNAAPPISPIPPYLRDDLGMPIDPLPRDRRGAPFHPVDPTMLHGWSDEGARGRQRKGRPMA